MIGPARLGATYAVLPSFPYCELKWTTSLANCQWWTWVDDDDDCGGEAMFSSDVVDECASLLLQQRQDSSIGLCVYHKECS